MNNNIYVKCVVNVKIKLYICKSSCVLYILEKQSALGGNCLRVTSSFNNFKFNTNENEKKI